MKKAIAIFLAVMPMYAAASQPQIRAIGQGTPIEQRKLGEVYHAASSSQVIRSVSADGDALLAGTIQPRMVLVNPQPAAPQRRSTPVAPRVDRQQMALATPGPARGARTGRLFLSPYGTSIQAATHRHGVEEALVRAVIHAESAYNPNAVSRAGAGGLMQLMPATARRFGVTDRFDPHQNIHGGTQYLAWLMRRYNGNITLATAAYNAGEGAVDKYGGVPPYRETQHYVRRVASLLWEYRDALGRGAPDGLPANSRPLPGVGYATAIRNVTGDS